MLDSPEFEGAITWQNSILFGIFRDIGTQGNRSRKIGSRLEKRFQICTVSNLLAMAREPH